MSGDNENLLSSVKFYALNDGNVHEFYDEWKFKTLALIRKKGWGVIFEDTSVAIPTEAEATAADATDEVKALYKANSEAYDQILMGCSGVPLGLVRRGQGDARSALEYLDMKYSNKTEADLTQLLNAFTNCKLESITDDPDKWFLQLDSLNEKLRQINVDYAKREYEIKAQMLGSLPPGYEDVRTKISGNETSFSVADIEREIRDKWKREYFKADDGKKDKNVAMNVERQGQGPQGKKHYKKPFKGRCRKCGKQGHKASECKSDKKGVCFQCGEDGHFARNCPKKGGQGANSGTGMFVGMTECVLTAPRDSNVQEFLMDSGASCHVIGSGDMLIDPETSRETIKVGDGTVMKATKQGTLLIQAENGARIKLTRVQVVPGIVKNIISTGCLATQGNSVIMEGKTLTVKNKEGQSFTVVMDDGSTLYHLKAKVLGRQDLNRPEEASQEAHAAATGGPTAKDKPIDIQDAHELYGHLNYGVLRPMLKNRGYVVVGDERRYACEACAYAKAKAKSVSKATTTKASVKGERLFLDISGPYKMALTGNKYWVLIVDDYTRKAWSFFVKSKNESKRVANELLTLLKGARVTTKYMRTDNAGENIRGLKQLCDTNGIQLEMTAPYTPQMNGVVERKFVTIRDRAHAMMLAARLDEEHQGKLWAEAAYTATRLHNIVPNRAGPAPDELWYGELPKIVDHLIKWGRIGYVKIRDSVTPKMTKKSIKMIFMGYSANHPPDTYRMYNPETGKVIHTRDVTWAAWHGGRNVPDSLRVFAKDTVVNLHDEIIDDFDEIDGKHPPPPTSSDTVDDPPSNSKAGRKDDDDKADDSALKLNELGNADENAVQGQLGNEGDNDDENASNDPTETQATAGNRKDEDPSDGKATQQTDPKALRVARELAKLNTYYNPTKKPRDKEDEMAKVYYVFHTDLASDPGEPKSFADALNSPDRLKWLNAIRAEIQNFMKRKAWKPMPLSILKGGQRPISVKWVFKKKHEQDGSVRFKARVCARGFTQVPGVDFNLTHSPVATEVSIRLVLAITLYQEDKGWDADMLDIEAAFLEAKLDEDVFIEWPPGVVMLGFVPDDDTKGKCLKLERAMYGAVQSPLAFWKECAAYLTKIGMIKSQADPCVWFKIKDGTTWLIAAIYVDDIIYSGTAEAREWFKSQMKQRFKIAELGSIKKHLGVWYNKRRDDKGPFYELTMEKYQQDIVDDWLRCTGKDPKHCPTPGYPGETLSKNDEDYVIQVEDYRKILGKLMWFVKKTMPEAANPIRELASHMDKPGEQHWRAMERVVGYIKQNDPCVLRLQKPRDLKCYAYVDSNFATNKENRKSVTGYIVTVGGCIVSWSSKTQPSVTLSSTEAEYVAASTCATEIKFIQMLLEEIMPDQEVRPGTLFEDNTGAIYLMENQAVGNRTKHIDVRMHHIREMMQGPDARLRVLFTRSESNFADVLTKNVNERIFTQLVPSLKNGDIASVMFQAVDREDVKKRYRTTDRLAADEPGDRCHVSTVEQHVLDFASPESGSNPDEVWTIVEARKKPNKNSMAKVKPK